MSSLIETISEGEYNLFDPNNFNETIFKVSATVVSN